MVTMTAYDRKNGTPPAVPVPAPATGGGFTSTVKHNGSRLEVRIRVKDDVELTATTDGTALDVTIDQCEQPRPALTVWTPPADSDRPA